MPTYDYKCLDCGSLFEYYQRITKEPLSICQSCDGRLKRLIGAGSGPLFKGNGFYHTDYKMNQNKSTTKNESKSNNGIGVCEVRA